MADASSWDTSRPAGNELISAGDDLMRADKTLLEAIINEEHIFTDDPESAGVHRPGSARAAVDELAAIPTPTDEGRLFFAEDEGEGLLYVSADDGDSGFEYRPAYTPPPAPVNAYFFDDPIVTDGKGVGHTVYLMLHLTIEGNTGDATFDLNRLSDPAIAIGSGKSAHIVVQGLDGRNVCTSANWVNDATTAGELAMTFFDLDTGAVPPENDEIDAHVVFTVFEREAL